MDALSSQHTYPLTSAQSEIWLAQLIHPDSPVYNVAQYTAIHGPFDVALFEAALRQVVEETQSLRVQFVEVDGQIRQYVASPHWELQLVDMSEQADPWGAAQAWMRADYERPIDLTGTELFRNALLRVAPNEVLWYERHHHVVMDGYSFALFRQRVAHVYTAMCAGVDPDPPFAPLSDLLERDFQYRGSSQWALDEAYWLEYCAHWPVPVTFAAQPAPALQHRLRYERQLSSPAVRRYATDSRRFAQFLTAAFAACLHRLTGAQEVVLGLPVAARFGEDKRIPGSLTNIIPLRFTVRPDMDLLTLMEQAAQHIQHGLRHQRYPKEALHRKLQLSSGHPLLGPLVNVMSFHDLTMGPCRASYHNLVSGPAQDVTMAVYALSDDQPLQLQFDVNPASYKNDAFVAHLDRLIRFIERAAAEPAQPIGRLDLLDAQERHRLLIQWNATARAYPASQCVHRLFEAQVLQQPDQAALVCGTQTIRYAELNVRANRLAHQLIALGVRPDMRVAVCMERSAAMVVGLLAILKAGGAYLPLDPAYSNARLAHILDDAAPLVLLADAAGRAALGEDVLAPLVVMDPEDVQHGIEANPVVPGLSAHHLAYVIYTSGSTGTPKGVMVEHRNLVNLCTWHNEAFDVHPGTRSSVTAGVAFDACAWEIWPSLLGGGTLLIPPATVRNDICALLHWWRQQPLDVAFLVTPLAAMALAENLLPSGLRYLLTGGDRFPALTQPLPAGLTLVNQYGPTEATVVATSGLLSAADDPPPIGRPIANTRIYVLDEQRNPVPQGVVGELYIGGAGVARGYLNRPELTDQRFLLDPFCAEAGARMYRTGDLVRYLPDGNLVFVARNDDQVKIRGFRIEPAEIEACLAKHPLVREAVVVTVGDGADKRLVAYVVADPSESLPATLRAHVAGALPDYMVPSAFLRLDAFALTPNGKIDRRALPAPDSDAFVQQAYEAPQGDFEIALAALWAELLGVRRIGRHDDFFALGGHSLLALQMTQRCRATLGVAISVHELFSRPSIAALSKAVLVPSAAPRESFPVLVPIRVPATRAPIFCIHPVSGLSWHYRGLASHLPPEQPVYGIQARGFDDPSLLATSIEAMAFDYIQQMRRIQPDGPYYLLGWSLGGNIAHSMATQLEQQGERIALLAVLDSMPDHRWRGGSFQPELDASYIRSLARYDGDAGAADPLERTREVMLNNYSLVKTFEPRTYCADMLFFRATIPGGGSSALIAPDAWRPYVLGHIETHDIACTHDDMDRPGPSAEIGRVLREKLDQLHGAPSQERGPMVAA